MPAKPWPKTEKKPPVKAKAPAKVVAHKASAAGATSGSNVWIAVVIILVVVGVIISLVVALLLMDGGSGAGGSGGTGGTGGGSGSWRDMGCPYQGTYGTCSYDLWCDPGETHTDCPSDCDVFGTGKQARLETCLQEPTDVDWDTCIALVAYDYDEINLCECILDSFLEGFCEDVISGDFDWDDWGDFF